MKKFLLLIILLFPISARAQFLYDTCTDTNNTVLTSHTPDIGGTWTQAEDSDLKITSSGTKCGLATTTLNSASNDAAPYSANYTTSVIYNASANTNTGTHGAALARRTAAEVTYYTCEYVGGANGARAMRITREKVGVFASLASTLFDWATSTDYTLHVWVYTNVAGNVVINCADNAGHWITTTDSSASKITATGEAGFMVDAPAGTGLIDNITADGFRFRRVL